MMTSDKLKPPNPETEVITQNDFSPPFTRDNKRYSNEFLFVLVRDLWDVGSVFLD